METIAYGEKVVLIRCPDNILSLIYSEKNLKDFTFLFDSFKIFVDFKIAVENNILTTNVAMFGMDEHRKLIKGPTYSTSGGAIKFKTTPFTK